MKGSNVGDNEGSEEPQEKPVVGLMKGNGDTQYTGEWTRVGNGRIHDIGGAWVFTELGTEGILS